MGAQNGTLLKMILLQAVTVGLIGYGLGVGPASLIGYVSRGSEPRVPHAVAARRQRHRGRDHHGVHGAAQHLKVVRLEPAIVFKG